MIHRIMTVQTLCFPVLSVLYFVHVVNGNIRIINLSGHLRKFFPVVKILELNCLLTFSNNPNKPHRFNVIAIQSGTHKYVIPKKKALCINKEHSKSSFYVSLVCLFVCFYFFFKRKTYISLA